MKFVETPKDDESIPIGPDGTKFLHRLLQVDPFKEKVKTAGDGIKLSSKEVVEERNEHNLEGKSIGATMETPSTGDVGFRDSATLERFKLWGTCGDLNLPNLPTHDPPKPSAPSSKR